MISLYCWNKAQKAGLLLNPELLRTHAEPIRAGTDVYWIDLDHPSEEEEKLVLEQFQPVHRLTRQDISRLRRLPNAQPDVPRIEAFPDYLFVVANALSIPMLDRVAQADPAVPAGPVERPLTQLNVVLTRKVLITHHAEPVRGVENLHSFLAKHEEQAERGPDYLFHLILDAMVDQFTPVLDFFSDRLDAMEEAVFHNPTKEQLMRILSMKREIVGLRKTLIYQREVLARLVRGDFAMIAERELAYYRNVYDHVIRCTELIESAREMIIDLMQTHMSASSQKLNEVMKVLAMISTTVLPMSLITGIYGMNFMIPEYDFELGYPMALGLMLLAGLGSLSFFKWKKWL